MTEEGKKEEVEVVEADSSSSRRRVVKKPEVYGNYDDTSTLPNSVFRQRSTPKKVVKKLQKPKPNDDSTRLPHVPAKPESTGKHTSAAQRALDNKEKQLDEMEESLIAAAFRRQTVATSKRELPVGPSEFADMDAALAQGFKEISTPVSDWGSAEAKMIGWICKVYWDGERKWFYARILNYDQYHKKHYVSSLQSYLIDYFMVTFILHKQTGILLCRQHSRMDKFRE